MGSLSIWQSELNESGKALSSSPLQGMLATEVAIIGAGITGTATALWLARAGARVRVLARRLWVFTVRNHEYADRFLEELEQRGWPCAYRRNGSLKLAAKESELETIIESASLLNQDGWEVKVVQRNDLPGRLRNAYFGGAFYPANGELQPARFVTGLALLAQQAGAVFHAESPVSGISVGEDGVLLNTPVGKLHARTLVLATNAWLPEIGAQIGANWLARCITPIRGQVIATEPVKRIPDV